MSVETACGSSRSTFRHPLDLVAGAFRSMQAVLAKRRLVNELDRLSDRHLRDIGVDRRQVAELVRRDTARSHLIETGWRGRRRG